MMKYSRALGPDQYCRPLLCLLPRNSRVFTLCRGSSTTGSNSSSSSSQFSPLYIADCALKYAAVRARSSSSFYKNSLSNCNKNDAWSIEINYLNENCPLRLTHISLASFLWDVGKQHSPRCDAAECSVPSGLFCLLGGIS